MFELVKTTPVYKLYRQSLIYDSVRKRGKVLKRAIKLPRYLGTEYRCPVCGTGLRAFRPMWKSYWRDVKIYQPIHPAELMETLNLEAFTCPRCDAFDRDRLTAIYLENAFASFDRNRTYRLLEFAPGDALHKKLKSYPFIAYRSADLSRKTVDERVDMTDMADYADGSLDVILCSHILEHIPDDRKAMREFAGCSNRTGSRSYWSPRGRRRRDARRSQHGTAELRWKYFGMGDHVRQYGSAILSNGWRPPD